MADEIVSRKLTSLRRCLARVREVLPDKLAAFQADLDAQDIVSINLMRAVQLCVDVAAYLVPPERPAPATMGQSFLRLAQAGRISTETADAMRRAVGFRNILVHSYTELDWEIAYIVCTERLGDFERFAEEIERG